MWRVGLALTPTCACACVVLTLAAELGMAIHAQLSVNASHTRHIRESKDIPLGAQLPTQGLYQDLFAGMAIHAQVSINTSHTRHMCEG